MSKHSLLILAGTLTLAALMFSCQTEREIPEEDITTVRCSIAQIDVEEDFATGSLDTLSSTRGSFSGNYFLWAEGDRIGIVPNSGAQIYFAVNNGAGTSTASFDGGDWAMKSTGTFYAYYPLYPDIFLSKDHVPVSYTGQVQSGNNNSLHTGEYWTLYTEGTTAIGNTLDFSFNHLTSFFKTYVTLPAGTYTKITFSAPSEVFIKEGFFDMSAQTPTIVGTAFTNELSLNLQDVTFTEETELIGLLVVAPVDIAGIPITVTVYKDGVATYEYSLTKANPMAPGKAYAFHAAALTQVVATVIQANALFASGETSVTISEPLTEDAMVVLPNTTEAVTLTLPATASTSTLTVSYPQNADSYPATLSITGPEGSNLDIYAPNSTVTVNGISYNQITSRTAANTCIISEGVSVNLLKVIQGGVQVYGTVSQIDLSEQEDDAIIYATGTVTTLLGEEDEEYIPATGVSLNKSSISLAVGAAVGAKEKLLAVVAPVGAYPNIIWTSSDETVATVSSTGLVTSVSGGSAIITAKTISGGFTAMCEVTVRVPDTIDGYEYVDLGLSVLWATNNIGASRPELVGSTFVWADTSPSSDLDWYQYKYCEYDEAYDDYFLTKYCCNDSDGRVVDNLKTIMPTDDAAYVNWGSHWRMPTKDVFEELINDCTWEATIQNNNYVYIVTGPNGNSIILPNSKYWSSTLSDNDSFYAMAMVGKSMQDDNRIDAYFIRPVGSKILATSITLNKSSLSIVKGEGATLTTTVSPSNATNKTVTWISSDPSIATVNDSGRVVGVSKGKAIITAISSFGNITATCEVVVSNACPWWAVDLGITTSDGYKVYWAEKNLCESGFVSSDYGYGDYFAWGETEAHYESGYAQSSSPVWKEGKNGYSWSTYKWCNGSSSTLTKYNNNSSYGTVDDLTSLRYYFPSCDDAAGYILRNGWRIPTKTEWEALMDSNNFEWTWKDNYYGVKGTMITSKIPGYEGNSIFLPAAGYRQSAFIDGLNAGYFGCYWSSSLYTDDPREAWYFSPKTSNTNCYLGHFERYKGCSVRAVFE